MPARSGPSRTPSSWGIHSLGSRSRTSMPAPAFILPRFPRSARWTERRHAQASSQGRSSKLPQASVRGDGIRLPSHFSCRCCPARLRSQADESLLQRCVREFGSDIRGRSRPFLCGFRAGPGVSTPTRRSKSPRALTLAP